VADTYNTHARRRYVNQASKRYKVGLKDQWSLGRISLDVAQHFDLPKPPANATVRNDLIVLDKNRISYDLGETARALLEPDRFPEWRAQLFRAPGNKEYLTPKHQLAWFHLIRAIALKEEPPEWVVTYLKITEALDGLDIREWVHKPEQMLTMFLLAPPRHGKSDLAAHVIIWLICRNPDIRILWTAGKLGISELTTAFVKAELESNEELIELYGPFENDDNWSKTSMTVATRKTRMRTPTLTAIGKGTTILSLDADIIFCDDIFDLRSSLSPSQVTRDVLWVKSQLMTRREPWTPLFGIGSHQPTPTGDAYSYMKDEHNNDIYFMEQKAHDYENCLPLEDDMTEEDRHGDNCLLWAGMRTFSYLEQFRKSLGDITYEVCYNQDASQSTLQYFRPEVVREKYPQPVPDSESGKYKDFNHYEQKAGVLDYKRSFGYPVASCCGGRGSLRTVMGFDPAASQAKGASESALIVLQGCTSCKRRYLIDYWHKRQSPEQHPDTIAQHAAQYSPQRVRIEINAFQKALARDPRLKKASLDLHFIIDEWTTTEKKRDPGMGVPLLARHMEQGRFSVPYELQQDRLKAEALLSQLVRYPSEPNDIIMALWLADLSLTALIDDILHVVPNVFDPLAPAYLEEQVVTINLSQINNWE